MLNFIKITILGGLLFLLPFAVIAALIGKLLATARPIVEPLSHKLALNPVAGFSATVLLSLVLLVAVSFFAGFLARTHAAKRLVKDLESHVLSRVPAYSLIKSVSEDFVGQEEGSSHKVVMVRFDDSRQLGIRTGETADGRFTIVFLPDSPTPQSGTVMIMESTRIEETGIPLRKALSALAGRGLGLEKHMAEALRPAS